MYSVKTYIRAWLTRKYGLLFRVKFKNAESLHSNSELHNYWLLIARYHQWGIPGSRHGSDIDNSNSDITTPQKAAT